MTRNQRILGILLLVQVAAIVLLVRKHARGYRLSHHELLSHMLLACVVGGGEVISETSSISD